MAAALAVVVACGACGACDIASTREQTATRDMHLYVTLDSTNAGTRVTAQLNGPFGLLDLGPGDSFALTVDGAPLATASDAAGFALDVPNRSGAFAFALHHAGDHDVTSTVPLPAPSGLAVTLGTGAGGAELTATWTPQPQPTQPAQPGVVTTLSVAGDCVKALELPILTDTGSYTVAGALLQSAPASCPITVELARVLDVETTPFADGATFMFARANQTESVQVAWTP